MTSKDQPEREIGDIGNYYGGLSVWEEDGRFWWSVEGGRPEEIPRYLFDALNRYEDARAAQQEDQG